MDAIVRYQIEIAASETFRSRDFYLRVLQRKLLADLEDFHFDDAVGAFDFHRITGFFAEQRAAYR